MPGLPRFSEVLRGHPSRFEYGEDALRLNATVSIIVSSALACGGADVAELVGLLACPLGPIPLAARGLAAVRGPGRRAAVVGARQRQRVRRRRGLVLISRARYKPLFRAASYAPFLTRH
jgi:hypothetical protein